MQREVAQISHSWTRRLPTTHGQLITAQSLVNSASRGNTGQTPISGAAKTGMAEISDNSDRPTPVAEDRPRLQLL